MFDRKPGVYIYIYIRRPFREKHVSLDLTKGLRSKRLNFAVRSGSTPTFLYSDLYLNSAYAAHALRLFNYNDVSFKQTQSLKLLAAN